MMIQETTDSTVIRIARIISILSQPMLVPVYGLLIIFSAPTLFGYLPYTVKKILLLIVLINNVIVPVTLMPWFRYRNIISSWSIENRSERIIPLITATFLYAITVYIFIKFHIPQFIKSFIIVTALLSSLITVINFWLKISIHSVGAGALTALVIVLSLKMQTSLYGLLIGAILLSGLIMTSRLLLNSHDPREVWSGYLLGILVTGLFLYFY